MNQEQGNTCSRKQDSDSCHLRISFVLGGVKLWMCLKVWPFTTGHYVTGSHQPVDAAGTSPHLRDLMSTRGLSLSTTCGTAIQAVMASNRPTTTGLRPVRKMYWDWSLILHVHNYQGLVQTL